MIKDIKAEFLLNYLYPELRHEWSTVMRGTFYRNYSDDIIRMDLDTNYLELSRDGFLQLLPSGLLSPEDERTSNEKVHRRVELLKEAFAPIDTFRFNASMSIERHVADLLREEQTYMLWEFFDYDSDAETNDYCRQAATLLPYASRLRGDIHFVRNMIEAITSHEVRMKQTAWSDTDNSRYWMPKVRYDVMTDDLTPELYRRETEKLQPLAEMIKDRFMPFDMVVEIGIKGENKNRKVLNYNTHIR